MIQFKRAPENPILSFDSNCEWESNAAFNPSITRYGKKFYMLYRAMSSPQKRDNAEISLSTIGCAESDDGIHFKNRRQVIVPRYDWEYFGCEDPRVTKIDNKYYIFYTALSTYPFSADGIKVGVGITEDFVIVKKHQVTPFNAKAMTLFPEKINGKYVAILTANSDLPPSKIGIASFSEESEMWSPHYWHEWYKNIDRHTLPLLRSMNDHVEVGSQPIKTDRGWLIIISYIRNYFSPEREFTIETVLLDLDNPSKIIGRSQNLMLPETEYEKEGEVKNIVFPSGASIDKDQLRLYYGAADTLCCTATIPLNELLEHLTTPRKDHFIPSEVIKNGFERYSENPIIEPRFELAWEQKGTLNPAVYQSSEGVHILYRAFSDDTTSTIGYAFSKNGYTIKERLPYPIYTPRADFESKQNGGFSGCEDARITPIGDKLFMLYTAFNGDIPRVAMTSIQKEDFLNHHFNWSQPKIISMKDAKDKNALIFPKIINGHYIILHRMHRSIYIDFISEERFLNDQEFLTTEYLLLRPRADQWDNIKIGSAAPPIETEAGWLLFYHGYSDPGAIYKVGAVLLDREDPRQVLARTDLPLIQPEKEYEKHGFVHNVVFPCGSARFGDDIYLYYGAADFVIGVAKMNIDEIIKRCRKT